MGARKDSKETIKEQVLRVSRTLDDWPAIKGYDFEGPFNFDSFLASYLSTGFQATNLGEAMHILRSMRDAKAEIFLAFTSNMGTSGVRESITYLVRHHLVHVLATSVGAIEEDVIKCFKPFVIGDFRAQGAMLRDEGINRTANIFIPNDRYVFFDRFMRSLFDRLYAQQQETGNIIDIERFVYEMGRELELQEVENREASFTYWAYRNQIPLYCPALPDGSVGDMLYFFKKEHPDFKIDTSDYIVSLTDRALHASSMGIFAIGGSVPKHLVANAGLFRDGAEFAVYVNTGQEGEGSNAGAPIDEAVSWGKIKSDARKVKVESEASIVVPLLVAGAFKTYTPKEEM